MEDSAAASVDAIAASLTDLGVVAGSTLMVHASLRRVGPVEGRATGLVEAIGRALGPDGTMVMMVAADDEEPFDRLETEADEEVGVLAEVFRTHPGVEVNDHPACRLAVRGQLASHLLEPQPLHHYYGPGSPLERLYETEGAAVLRLGSDIDTVTLTHYAEYRATLASKRQVERRYVRADTGEVFVTSLDDSDGIDVWPHGDYFGQILVDFVAQGHAAAGPVGRCTAELLDARRFVDFAVAWLEREFS